MSKTTDVAIIGGGAAGCAAAYYLAREGVKATIIEREGIGSQASGYSAGGLNPLEGAGIPNPLGPLAMESFQMHMALWERLQAESGVDFHPIVISMVKVAFDEHGLAAMKAVHETFESAEGFSARWLDGAGLRELEPRLSSEAIGGLHTHGNAVLDSQLYTVALSRAAESLGAEVCQGEATDIKVSGGRVTGVALGDDEISCGSVVVATGPWSQEVGDWLGVPVPVEPLKGEILRMELPDGPLACDFQGAGAALFRRRNQLWVGATEERRGFDREPSESAKRKLLDGATRLAPAVSDARLVQHTACLRPLAPDWLPIIGRASGWDNAYLATGAGKKGILISPGIGKAIADLIVRGRTRLPIGPFNPDRFIEKHE